MMKSQLLLHASGKIMKKILIFIVAYEAERHIASVLARIPKELWESSEHTTDLLLIDDASTDNTIQIAREAAEHLGHKIRLCRTPHNQGYGGNQKLGYRYAVQHGYDAVVLLHGDGQYAPEYLPAMIAPLLSGAADVVFGSRMMEGRRALKGGMPLYKYIANRLLTSIQNRLIGLTLSEFHSGYRAYATRALARIPYHCNANGFSFDTDIIIQLADNGITMHEIAIPTHYGDEVCRVNGTRYAIAILKSCLQSRLMRFGLFYSRKFDYADAAPTYYRDKTGFSSSHSFAVNQIPDGSHVLDIGDAPSHVARALKQKSCRVTGIDRTTPEDANAFDDFHLKNLSALHDPAQLPATKFDAILLLDVIEHMPAPEATMELLWRYTTATGTPIVFTTPNIAFITMRLMLLLGWFHYGRAGILDRTHTRLFTFRSARHLVTQAGFRIIHREGIPAPFPLALRNRRYAQVLLRINRWLIRVSKTLFSYQIAFVLEPRPDLEQLLADTITEQHTP
jgi:glycosyltransferase involved in cell wall biosynthesis/2-polyprenyl-3-methyl-5-hydroxy-6-metoxy-1,4-benzoquinol methylase